MAKIEENLQVSDKVEAFVITGKMVKAAAKVLENAIGLGPGRAEELAREMLTAAWVARNNS